MAKCLFQKHKKKLSLFLICDLSATVWNEPSQTVNFNINWRSFWERKFEFLMSKARDILIYLFIIQMPFSFVDKRIPFVLRSAEKLKTHEGAYFSASLFAAFGILNVDGVGQVENKWNLGTVTILCGCKMLKLQEFLRHF